VSTADPTCTLTLSSHGFKRRDAALTIRGSASTASTVSAPSCKAYRAPRPGPHPTSRTLAPRTRWVQPRCSSLGKTCRVSRRARTGLRISRRSTQFINTARYPRSVRSSYILAPQPRRRTRHTHTGGRARGTTAARAGREIAPRSHDWTREPTHGLASGGRLSCLGRLRRSARCQGRL
jgi:hypothetical protein